MNASHGFRRALRPPQAALKPFSLRLTRPVFSPLKFPHQNVSRSITKSASSKLETRSSREPAIARTLGNDRAPLRVAVIGSGPAGFYSARRVLQHSQNVRVDMYEQLPVPFGLARFGVAPDHPEVKKCEETFVETAADDRFQFFGNVSVGKDVALSDLRDAYDVVLFAYGAVEDRTLGIPGEEELKGIYSARAFVGWYNGLPEYANLKPDLEAGDTAVVIGQGNVALDVARVLLGGVDRLRNTDIADSALEILSKSKVNRVHVVGRRGLVQTASTIKELRELLTMPGVKFDPIPSEFLPTKIDSLNRQKRRLAQLMQAHSSPEKDLQSAPKLWSMDFMLSPSRFLASTDKLHQLSSIEFSRTRYAEGEEDVNDPSAKVLTTDAKIRMDAALAFRSIGYKSLAIPGMEELGINFDTKQGIIANINGRVISSVGEHIRGLYCTGWVKSGPTGVIATTMNDAFAAADALIADWHEGSFKPISGREGWLQLKGKVKVQPVSWQGWLKIDGEEKRLGHSVDKPREKIRDVETMLQIASGA